MTTAKKQLALDIILFLIIALFVYAAVSKLIDYERFEATIGKSPLIAKHATWVAIAVPGIEILISLILIIPRLRLVGLYLAFMLMAMFTLYIAFILTFSPYVPCSCGGILNSMGWSEHLIFNITFIGIALAGILITKPADATMQDDRIPHTI
jgi:uncharacterized membrane protein YphA (DoxX/SURF4 family)